MFRKLRILMLTLLVAAALVASQSNSVTGAQGADKLEVFSYWTSGGEAAALQGLFDTYKKVNPKTEITNAAVSGGAGTNAAAVLQTRLQGKNPPDTWQTHPSAELQGLYADPGYVEPLTDLNNSESWDKGVPQRLIDNL